MKLFLLTLFLSFHSSAEIYQNSGYQLDTEIKCDGWPRVSVGTLNGQCLGFIAGKKSGLKMPRYATQGMDGVIYVSDMGAWAWQKGTVWALVLKQGSVQLVDLFPNHKLTTPNGIALDPEGRVYIGTPTGIYRFFPRDSQTGAWNTDPQLELVDDFMKTSVFRKGEYEDSKSYSNLRRQFKNKHPLVQLAFNNDFSELYVNIGAPSDRCESGFVTKNDKGFCAQSESPLASAGVWRIQFSKDQDRRWLSREVFSRGLRNSMALTVHPSGRVFQGENNIDLPDEDQPFEELNELELGRHYGWPYCYSQNQVSDIFKTVVTPDMCSKNYKAPLMFMPAHVAPLSLLYYSGATLIKLQQKLLVSWHGYRQRGHQIVAYPVDYQGRPTQNNPEQIVYDWKFAEGKRPLGAPVGLTQLQDGSVLILEDKNSSILRLAPGESWINQDLASKETPFEEAQIANFEKLMPFLQKNCKLCHSPFKEDSAIKVLNKMGHMLNRSRPEKSLFYLKIKAKTMPPETVRSTLRFNDREYQEIDSDLENFIHSLGAVNN